MKPQINKWTTIIIAVLFVTLIIIPLIRNDIGLARNPQNYMSQGWQEATQYLRSQLPLEQEVKYYEIYKEGESLDMPYVFAWWDYGYWIVRDAHMPVICHPGGGKRTLVAEILLNENPQEVVAQLKELNIKYIIIDSQTAVEKFYSLVEYTGGDLGKYYEYNDGEIQRTGDYYETFMAQLYFFNAKRVNDVGLVFVSDAKVDFEGNDVVEVKVFEAR